MAYGALLSLPTSQGIRRDVYLDFNAMKFGIQTVRRTIKHFELHGSWQKAVVLIQTPARNSERVKFLNRPGPAWELLP